MFLTEAEKERLKKIREAFRVVYDDKGSPWFPLEDMVFMSDLLDRKILLDLVDKENTEGADEDSKPWVRYRFETTGSDYRPIKVPPPGPWWCTGRSCWREGEETNILVAYAHSRKEILGFWPDATAFSMEDAAPEGPKFSGRFPKPEGWDEVRMSWVKS